MRTGVTAVPDPRERRRAAAPAAEGESESESERGSPRRSGEVTSLVRGLTVLRCFHGSALALGNGEIAQRTGLPKSTVSRIAATLAAHGYLELDPARRRYRSGPAALLLGCAQMESWKLAQVARPYMKPLAEYAHAVVGVGAALEDSMIYVECQRGTSDVGVDPNVGSRVPMDLSAMGWAYLYALDRSKREAVIDRLRTRRGSSWGKVEQAMDRAFREIETRGFCIAAGFWKPHVSAVGVPLRLPDRSMYLALNCGAPRSLLSTEDLVKDYGPRLVQVAKQIAVCARQL